MLFTIFCEFSVCALMNLNNRIFGISLGILSLVGWRKPRIIHCLEREFPVILIVHFCERLL